jgi:nucleolar protein 56
MARTVVTTWFGTFLVDSGEVVASERAPASTSELVERIQRRSRGELTPEEERVIDRRGDDRWSTRDRRLATRGVTWSARAPAEVGAEGGDRDRHREAILAAAGRALADAWDPSVHVEEAVRAESDLDRVRNLVGERLGSWVSRDSPEVDPGDHAAAARAALADEAATSLGPTDPAVRAARRRLAELYRDIGATQTELANAVRAAVPTRTPNLTALLGPDLTARLLAQARGLGRLARLPARTIQVLGAERAFFEHLRGHAPPPRHGLLFLHPAIQSATRHERGKLARSLAGKVAIAARLDAGGKPVDPSLARAFEARRARITEERAGRRSRKPLHAAARDR